jgi:hypothetical protein
VTEVEGSKAGICATGIGARDSHHSDTIGRAIRWSAVRVRSSALYFVAICRENFGAHRCLGDKAEANLLHPAEEPLFVA